MTFSAELFKNISYICLDFLMFDRFEVWFLEKKFEMFVVGNTVGSVPILCSNFGILVFVPKLMSMYQSSKLQDRTTFLLFQSFWAGFCSLRAKLHR